MDRKKLASQLKDKKKTVIAAVAVIALLAGTGFWFGKKKPTQMTEAHAPQAEAAHEEATAATDAPVATAQAAPAEPSGFYHAFSKHWNSAWEKLGELERSEVQNERLRLENAFLRQQLEAKTFAMQAEEARRLTDSFGKRIEVETGSPVGRLLSSISYQPPVNLLPRQLYALGVSYFKAREDEKAAVIFTQLLESSATEEFKTPRNYLLAGVSWYRLDHFEAADTYLSRALAQDGAKQHEEAADQADSRVAEELALFAQARLWRALTAKRLGDEKNSQNYLVELVDHSPSARESQWVNREESLRGREKGGRGVASQK